MAFSGGYKPNGASRPSQESQPIYHGQSPKKVIALKIYFAVVTLVVISAVIYCLVIAVHRNKLVLMLADVNLLLSSIVGVVLVHWYRNEVLPDDKLWYLLLFGILIAFQCVAIDVFAHHDQTGDTVSPTQALTTEPLTTNISNFNPTKVQLPLY